MSQNKKTRRTRSRSSRGKTQRDDSCFGIRYLHYHMFTKRNGDEKQECPYDLDCKCGTIMASVYSGKILVAMTFAIVILLVGITFMLVGYLIPRRAVVYLEKDGGTKLPLDRSAISFNTMLDDFTLTGTVLLSVGALCFSILLIVPICRASFNRKGEYLKAPTEDVPTSLTKTKVNESHGSHSEGSSVTSSDTLQKIPVLALVHNIQPQKTSSAQPPMAPSSTSRKEYKMKKSGKYKDSFDEED